jgi:hypothetical protein
MSCGTKNAFVSREEYCSILESFFSLYVYHQEFVLSILRCFYSIRVSCVCLQVHVCESAAETTGE